MHSFSKFIKGGALAPKRKEISPSSDRRPVYEDTMNINESMLKGVWKMLPKQNTTVMAGEEDAEVTQSPKVEQARALFKQLYKQQDSEIEGESGVDANREAVIQAFLTRIGVKKRSTAVNYFERFKREFSVDASTPDKNQAMGGGGGNLSGAGGVTAQAPGAPQRPDMASTNGSQPPPPQPDEESDDPDRQGVIRVVNNAHMIFKRTQEDSTYEELWIYNINDQMKDELQIRRAILAGTDIEPGRTASTDGTQRYDSWTIGNAQMIHVVGLPN